MIVRTAFEESHSSRLQQFSNYRFENGGHCDGEYVTSEAANRQICFYFSILQVIIFLVLISSQVPHNPPVLQSSFEKRPSSTAEKLWLICCSLTGRLTAVSAAEGDSELLKWLVTNVRLFTIVHCLHQFCSPKSTIIAVAESIIKHGQI